MKAAYDSRRLDVAAFSGACGQLQGVLPVADLKRLTAGLAAPASDSATGDARDGLDVQWQVQGLAQRSAAGPMQYRLHLKARGRVWQHCQRCLEPLLLPLEVDHAIRFVASESEAERLDEEGEEDVLSMEHPLDLVNLLEDELILALPLVPRHPRCEAPASSSAPAHRPFEALADLRPGALAGPRKA